MSSYTGCHKYVPFETRIRIDDQLGKNFRFLIADCRLRIADLWNRYALSIIMDRSTQKLTTGRIP